jgi:hypothetical protein
VRKLRSPYFVSAEVLKDGEVRLVDDDGEIYHVEMRRDDEWPILSRQTRNREMRRTGERMNKQPDAPRPPQPSKPRVIS